MSRRSEILDVAAELFEARGFHGVGVDEIGKRVGISGPALYHHFSGKDEILATLFNDAMDQVTVGSGELFADPRSELEFLIRHQARFVVEHPRLLSVYVREHRSLVDPYKRMFDRRVREHARRWERVLARCHPDAGDEDVAAAVQATIGLLHSAQDWPPRMLQGEHAVDRLVGLALGVVDSLARA